MKSKQIFLAILAIFISLFTVKAQDLNYKVTDVGGKEKLLGPINEKGLSGDSFQAWYKPQFTSHQVDQKSVKTIKNELKNYTIKAFMGTWCGDSKREVPRFYKILEAADFPKSQLMMVAVDNLKPNYKKSPGGEEKGLNIVKVPTFIFYKDGKEVNRIIEFPVRSLEKDIEAIVTGKSYVPNYNNIPVLPVD